MKKASSKAAKIGMILQQFMPNVGGPKSESRILLGTVVHSVLLYCPPLWWGHQAGHKTVIKYMSPVQRKMALCVISGYGSIMQDAALVLAGMPPIWLLGKERANPWKK